MGSKWSKSSIVGWPEIRERIRRTPPAAAPGVGAVSQDLDTRGAITSSNMNHPSCVWLEAQEDEEVGFPVRPQVPLRPMTLQVSFRSQPLFKRKGGTGRVNFLPEKKWKSLICGSITHKATFPDWQNYTPGPGIRYPLTFGWCFKLVPVDPSVVEEATEGENNSLLHPMCQHGMDDDEKEVLVWRFDSTLALKHRAHELHPEYFKNC
uniref:Protein Nef n=1 Tax=Human immunodeficiency virus type 1 TaxID=11676 RepID=Q5U6Q0_HV1|nr:nef protein [Human immunodeficiency virus 1]